MKLPKQSIKDRRESASFGSKSQNSSSAKLMSRQPNSVQRDTYIRANYNKKKIKQPDFPAEAPKSNSYKYEAGNAEHSLHDLSSESSKECSLTEFNESCDRAKNDSGANQAQKHSVPRGIQKNLSLSRGS